MTKLPKNRTIASLTKVEILTLPGFESFGKDSARKLKELVKSRVNMYASRSKKKTRGFTVGDYIESYEKDTKLIRNTAVENLKKDINRIAENAEKAQEDFKDFEAENANGSHTTKDSGSHTTKDSGSHTTKDSGSHTTKDSGSHTKAKTTKEEVKKEHKKEDKSEEERKKEDAERKRKREEEKRAERAAREEELLEEYRKKSPKELDEIAKNAITEAEFQAVRRAKLEVQEREQAEQDRQWEAAVKEIRKKEEEEFKRKLEEDSIMEFREVLRNIIETDGKDSKEYYEELKFLRDTYGEEFLEKVLGRPMETNPDEVLRKHKKTNPDVIEDIENYHGEDFLRVFNQWMH